MEVCGAFAGQKTRTQASRKTILLCCFRETYTCHLPDLHGAPPQPAVCHGSESPEGVHLLEAGEQRLRS